MRLGYGISYERAILLSREAAKAKAEKRKGFGALRKKKGELILSLHRSDRGDTLNIEGCGQQEVVSQRGRK